MTCSTNRVHTIKRGDTARKFTDTFEIDGDPIDLTGATVKFLLKNTKTGVVLSRTATVVDAEAGEVEYQLVSGDVDTVGRFLGEWEITYTGGKLQTVPEDRYIDIEVRADLNPP